MLHANAKSSIAAHRVACKAAAHSIWNGAVVGIDVIHQFHGDKRFPVASGLRVGIEAAVLERESVGTDQNHFPGSACREVFFQS